jgi:hypothetical protein
MSEIERVRTRDIVVGGRGCGADVTSRRGRQTLRALAGVQQQTLVRVARVQAEGFVQTEKVREIDHLAREAMSGQAMLQHWANTLSRADVLLADELRFFTDVAKLGKGEILADTITTFCQE